MPRKTARKSPKSRKSKTKKRSVRKANLRRISVVGLLFVISFLFLTTFTFKKFIDQNFVLASSVTSYSFIDDPVPTVLYIIVDTLDESDDINVVKMQFNVLDKNSKKAIRYEIPLNVAFDMPGEFGEAELCKTFLISALSSENKFDDGIKLLANSVTKAFGFKVDRYMVITQNNYQTYGDILYEGRIINFIKTKDILNAEKLLRSNMSLNEFTDARSFLMALPKDRVVDRDLSEFSEQSFSFIDEELRDITFESAMSHERLSISILNGTDYSGFASFGTRVVKNLGGRVVAMNNSDQKYDQSYIITKDKDSTTVAQLVHVFDIPSENVILREDAYNFSEDEIRRSDIVLILGFDTAGKLY